MRFLTDEHVALRLVPILRERGHDVVSVVEVGLTQTDDRLVWQWAIQQERVVVTYDVDDFLPLFEEFFHAGIHHHGLVVISTRTIPQDDFGTLLRSLERLLTSNQDLSDQVLFLNR